MMKGKLLYISALLLLSLTLGAQQEQLFTQFMFHKMEYNPAYAGQRGQPMLTAAYRDQWIGLEGAPVTQKLSFHFPLTNDRIGLGINLNRHSIGITTRLSAGLNYAYAIPFESGKLSIGLSTSFRQIELDFTDERLVAAEDLSMDPAVTQGVFRTNFGNVGMGFYFNHPRFYAGISVPRILQSDLQFGGDEELDYMEARHFYLMGGYDFQLNESMNLVPQLLLKKLENAPLNVDVNINLHLMDRYLAGLGFRTYSGGGEAVGESVNILLGVKPSDPLFIGLSYDLGLNPLKSYHSGSFEAVVQYGFTPAGRELANPRFF